MSSLELYKVILDGHLCMKKGAMDEAKVAVDKARQIIESDPLVTTRAIPEMIEFTEQVKKQNHPNQDGNDIFSKVLWNDFFSIPIHWVCHLCNHEDMVRLINEKTEEVLSNGIQVRNEENHLITIYPESALSVQTTRWMKTPLYHACYNKEGDINTFRLIFELYPKAAKIKCTPAGMLPLHHCVLSRDLEKTTFLLEALPESALVHDDLYWKNSLQLAAFEFDQDMTTIIERIMDICPTACTRHFSRLRDDQSDWCPGWLAIHQALSYDDSGVNGQLNGHSLEHARILLQKSYYHGLFDRADGFGFDEIEVASDEDMGMFGNEYAYQDDTPSWEKHTPWSVWIRRCIDRGLHEDREGAINSIFLGRGTIREAYPNILLKAIGKVPLCDIEILSMIVDHTISNCLRETPFFVAVRNSRYPEGKFTSQYTSQERLQLARYYIPVIFGLFQYHVDLSTRNNDDGDEDMDVDRNARRIDFNNIPYEAIASMRHVQDQRYLLHYVCEEGLPWFYVKEIVKANIHAVSKQDGNVKSGLFPFMLMSQGPMFDLSSAFELLRIKPDIIKQMV